MCIRDSPGAAVALADLDGDADLDVVVARDGPSVVAPAGVFLGNGNGTLGAMTTYGSGGSARAVAVGHIDSDPWQELVLGGTAGVRVLKGLAGGAFGAQSSYLDGISIDAVGIADVDADGRREVPAVSAGRNAISVLAFDLGGAFTGKSVYGTGRDPRALAMADFNGDSRPDLATADYGDTTVTVILNRTGNTTAVPGPVTNAGFTIEHVYPSPAYGAVRIGFVMPSAAPVRVRVLDVTGRDVATLVRGTQSAGRHETVWEARTRAGPAPPGIYFVRFEWPGGAVSQRIALTR